MTVEREISVHNVYYGTVCSVPVGEADRTEPADFMNMRDGQKLIYGYVLTKDGEMKQYIAADFGYEHIQDAINACMAHILKSLYAVHMQENVLTLE
nr:MAG TPA: hypothetical protein [Caudoviricetes sp.]